MRRAARQDDNHQEIVQALRRAGWFVADMSGLGSGAPDLLACRGGVWRPIEIKDGNKSLSERKLTPDQVKWHSDALVQGGGRVAIVTSVEEAFRL